ncbi:hypothetical protein Tco_0968150 [Tanacetum coccineum]
MESLNSNFQKRELYQLQQMQDKAKESCMISFRLLHSHLKSKEGKVDSSTALDAGLVVTESNKTESERHVSSSRSEKDTHAKDAEINSMNDKQPLAQVQLTVQHDTLANEQQHFVQSEPIYDTHLLEKVDRNTIPDSTNMCHRGGEIEQNAEKCHVSCPLLDPSFDNMTTEFSNQSIESENIFLKKTVAQLQKDLSRMEAHCVNMELKYQNQALKDGQHGQILNETSNKAKINKEIEVLEKINIELEHSVAKLLADNEKLHKENEHLKQTYKDLYDSIKTTRVQTKDHNDSLIAQINSKTVENADLKAQIQEKVFANVALKNELRKLKGNSVDTKFAKPSILGKPVLQPPRNQSVVRQPNAFKSERPNFSKPRFASQVDVNNVLSKPVTQHYLPKGRESAFAKPNHMIASSSSRNSSKNMPRFSSNDMVHNYYLEEAKKKTQERDRKSTTSVMPSAKSQNTTKSCKSKPRSNNQTSRVLPTSKSSCPTTTVMPKAYHSRNPSSFSDFKHFEFMYDEQGQWLLITSYQHPYFMIMASVDNTSGLVPQRKERIMDITKAEQITLDDALVAPANRLKIGKCNLRLSSDLTSKEATLQVVYDVLKLTPFYKAFQASTDVPEIYMHEEMLQICPIIRNQKFDEPPFEQEILTSLISLGHSGEIRKITNVNVNKLHQPWRLFAAFINKCLSDPSIPRRNKINWHYARDDLMFIIINVISRHEDTQLRSTSKKKASVHKKKSDSDTTPKEKPPTDPKDKRVKQTGKMTGSGKQKQPTTGLETLSEIALTETEQLKIATKRSRIQTLNSQESGSGDEVDILSKVPNEQVHEKTGTDEEASDKLEVPDVPEHHSNSEEESWTFSDGVDDANQDLDAHDDDDDDATESDDDDEEQEEDDDEDEEDISDQLVRTSLDYQASDESEKQKDDDKVKDDEEDKEGDVTNVNLEGGDVDMTEADTTKDTEDAHVTLTAATPVVQQQSSSVLDLVSNFISPTTDEGIDYILTPRTESTTLVNVPISIATETLATTITIPPPLFPVTQSSQQTPVTTTTTTNPSTTPLPIPSFAFIFGFNQRVITLEYDLSKLKQSNPFAEAISSISGIVNEYLGSKMKEAVDVAIQLKSNKLREEA